MKKRFWRYLLVRFRSRGIREVKRPPSSANSFTFTLPTPELAGMLRKALEEDHQSLEQIALGWLFFGRGIVEVEGDGAREMDVMEARVRLAALRYGGTVNEDSIRRAREAMRRAVG